MTRKEELIETRSRIQKHKELAEKMQNADLLDISQNMEEYVNMLIAEEEKTEKINKHLEDARRIIEEFKAELDKT